MWLDKCGVIAENLASSDLESGPGDNKASVHLISSKCFKLYLQLKCVLMPSPASWHLLPIDLVELQLGQIDLLLAMYPDDITLEDSSQKMIDALRELESDTLPGSFVVPPVVPILLEITIPSDDPSHQTLGLDLLVPFTYEGDELPSDQPKVKVRIRQPPWLSRASTNQLMIDLSDDEDLLGTIEHIKDAAVQQLEQAQNSLMALNTPDASNDEGPLVRVWFYFPSISTRSKRDDFIIHAPSYQLTGFLYAGKPGLLCVEGGSQNIDDYMKFIKTESWGDIPAHHKKVSERYRETNNVQRVFSKMTETTDMVGERRGQRANRGDMKAMEEWLVERGLGDAFTKVLM